MNSLVNYVLQLIYVNVFVILCPFLKIICSHTNLTINDSLSTFPKNSEIFINSSMNRIRYPEYLNFCHHPQYPVFHNPNPSLGCLNLTPYPPIALRDRNNQFFHHNTSQSPFFIQSEDLVLGRDYLNYSIFIINNNDSCYNYHDECYCYCCCSNYDSSIHTSPNNEKNDCNNTVSDLETHLGSSRPVDLVATLPNQDFDNDTRSKRGTSSQIHKYPAEPRSAQSSHPYQLTPSSHVNRRRPRILIGIILPYDAEADLRDLQSQIPDANISRDMIKHANLRNLESILEETNSSTGLDKTKNLSSLATADSRNNSKRQINMVSGSKSLRRMMARKKKAIVPDLLPIQLALKHVSDNISVLPDYQLYLASNTSKCSAAEGTKVFFDMMFNPPSKLMLFGGACTKVTAPIAEASAFWNLIQISYAEVHPKFSSRQTYPNFYRIITSLNFYNFAGIQILKHFNWTKVGTIFQDDPKFTLPHDDFLNKLDSHDFQIALSRSFNTPDKLRDIIIELKNSDIRIIVAYLNETMTHYAFCYIYQESYYGPKFQWILLGGMSDVWLDIMITTVPCNKEQIYEAVNHAIRVDLLPLSSSDDKTISGYTSGEYLNQYNQLRGDTYSRYHGYAYDGIWAIALALNYVTEKLKKEARNKTLLDFNYNDPEWSKLFKEALNASNFMGVTGPVQFLNGNRKGLLDIKQVQDKEEVKIAEYDGIKNLLLFTDENISWAGKRPAIASPKIIHSLVHINFSLYLIMAILSTLGIVLALLFLAINIRYRTHRYIKMSSPHLNNVIIFGGILAYVSIIILGLDSFKSNPNSFSHLCMARVWILSLAFTLSFGAMFSKTWRVHAIFTNVKLNKKIIQDYKLFIIIAILLLIDIVILSIWSIVDPFYKQTENLPNRLTQSDSDIEIVQVVEHCASRYSNIWLAILIVYKGILMLFGCFLAWETRHVKIPALNDSKYIGISVYNIMLLCIVGTSVAFVLKNEQNTSFLLLSIFIMLGATITLCLVFVPKIIQLKNIFKSGESSEKSLDRPRFKEKDKYQDFRKRVTRIVDEKHRNKRALQEKNRIMIDLMNSLGMEISEKDMLKLSDSEKSSTLFPEESWAVKLDGKKFYIQPKSTNLPSITEFTEAYELSEINSINKNDGKSLKNVKKVLINHQPNKILKSILNNNKNAIDNEAEEEGDDQNVVRNRVSFHVNKINKSSKCNNVRPKLISNPLRMGNHVTSLYATPSTNNNCYGILEEPEEISSENNDSKGNCGTSIESNSFNQTTKYINIDYNKPSVKL